MKNKILIFLILLLCIGNLYGIVLDKTDKSKGPLYGKNMYIPYSIFYNFTGLSAKSGEKYKFEYNLSLYYTNDNFIAYFYYFGRARAMRDYESLTVELGLSFYILKNLQIGINTRLNSYYGGFLDVVIEGFHGVFGFPNGGRNFLPRNQIH